MEKIEHGLEIEMENDLGESYYVQGYLLANLTVGNYSHRYLTLCITSSDEALKYFKKQKRRIKFTHIPSICVGNILFKQGKYLGAINEYELQTPNFLE